MQLTYRQMSWALIFVLSTVCAPAWAQIVRNGSIGGTITDNTGAALPGVTITVTSPALQVPQLVRVSEGDGTYEFPDLPVGTYRLVYGLEGFSTLVREEIRLTTGFAARVDVVLPLSTLAETITVTGQSPLVDVTNTRGGTTATRELLAAMPVNQDFQAVLSLSAGVFIPGVPRQSRVGLSQAAGNNSTTTYGQNTRMGAWVEGIQASMSSAPDFAASEEVDIKAYGNTAETSLPGATIQVLYKSGGNDFRGTVRGSAQSSRFQSNNVDDALRRQGITAGQDVRWLRMGGVDAGGRIVRNKLWYFGALDWAGTDRAETGFSADPGPDGLYLTADDTAGFPRSTQINPIGKLSYQPTAQHKFIGFIDREWTQDIDYNAGRFRPHEAARTGTYVAQHAKVEWQGVFSSRLLANMMFGRTGYRIYNRPNPDVLANAALANQPCRLYLDTTLVTGPGCGIFSGSGTGANVEYRGPIKHQWSGALSYYSPEGFGGVHNLTVGFQYLPGTQYVDFPMEEGQKNYEVVYDRVGTGPYRPSEFRTTDLPVKGTGRQDTAGIYVNDSWRPTPRLTVNGGLRWDWNHSWIDPQVKPQGEFGFAGSFPLIEVGTWNGFAPRIGGAFDLFGNGKTVAKATFGVYIHSEPNNNGNPISFLALFNKNNPSVYFYRWRDTDGNNDYTPGEVNLDVNGPDFLDVLGSANNIPNPDMEWGKTQETSASLERELVPNVSLRGLWVFKRVMGEPRSRGFVNSLRPRSVWNQAFTRRDAGPDNVLNTGDDGGTVTVYDYDPEYRGARFVANIIPVIPSDREDRFQNVEVSLSKRTGSGKWFANTAMMVTKNHRWIEAFPETPNSDMFPLDETWDWLYRFGGGYNLPYQITASTVYQLFSGVSGQRTAIFRAVDPDGGPRLPSSPTITLRMEPFGATRLPAKHLMDVRLSKAIPFGGRRLKLDLDVFNVLNTNVAFAASFLSGSAYGYVTTISPPRVLRFGASLDF